MRYGFTIIVFTVALSATASAQPVLVVPAPGTTATVTVNGQTFTVTTQAPPAVPYRKTYPDVKKWSLFDYLLWGDPQVKIDCADSINRFDPRCGKKAAK